jgi:YD repeat-containing protein
MRETPSIVPESPEDIYLVINHYSRHGTAFAETDLARANYETVVADLLRGQYSDPLRVVMYNTATDRAQQQRTLYDSRGNVVGRSATDSSGSVTNYDARGWMISRETTSGNTTTIYDAGGRNVGRVTTNPQR